MLTTLVMLTAAAAPSEWMLRTSYTVDGHTKTDSMRFETLGQCETVRDGWLWAMGPPIRGYRGSKAANCVRVKIPARGT